MYGFGFVRLVQTKHIQMKVRIPCARTNGAGDSSHKRGSDCIRVQPCEAVAYGFGFVRFVQSKHIQLKVRKSCPLRTGRIFVT